PTFVKIVKKGEVEQFSPIPYLATFVNCGIWVLYGLPLVHPHSLLVITINGSGFVIETIYLLLFLIYSDRKQRVKVLLIALAEILFLVVLTALVLTVAHTTKVRSSIVGSIAIVGNIMMYASPLSVMIPNGLGSLLGITQLILYATFYKSTKRQLAERKASVEMGPNAGSIKKINVAHNEHP
ncbi:SWEET sugar transporter, partial [Cynara cardunculus var. scolymus]